MSATKFEEWARLRENCLVLARHWDTGLYADWNTRLSERAYRAGYIAGLEAAAKVCEDKAEHRLDHAKGPYLICATAIRAFAIRALKGE